MFICLQRVPRIGVICFCQQWLLIVLNTKNFHLFAENKKSLMMIEAAGKRRKYKKQVEPQKSITESSNDEESDDESIDIAAIKDAATEKMQELLHTLILEHKAGKLKKKSTISVKKKNAAGKLKNKTISVTECSTSRKQKKGKRAAAVMDSDSEDEGAFSKLALVTKKKLKKERVNLEEEDEEVRVNEPKSIKARMSPRSLMKVLEKLRIPQVQELQRMGFGEFYNNFNFYYVPSELGLWVVRSFDSKTCSLKMEDGRKIKITREVVRDILGIPMGDIKVQALLEKNLFEETTAKWREEVESIVVKNKIYLTKLEEHLTNLTEADWEFQVAFLVLFFSVFGQGNKDGEVNEKIVPILSSTENVSQMDWCSYVLDCLVEECRKYNEGQKQFSGPLLLLVLIYVNSTTSNSVKVDKTIPAFKAWSSQLLLKRQKEEIELGFGCLPIAEGVEVIQPPMKMIEPPKKKKLNKKQKKIVTGDEEQNLQYGTIDKEEVMKEFKSKTFEEMKKNIKDRMVMCNQLMLDIDYKLMISLRLHPDDKELKDLVEVRRDLFCESYKDDFEKDADKDGDKNVNKDGDKEVDGDRDEGEKWIDNDEVNDGGGDGGEDGDYGNYQSEQMGNDNINVDEGRKEDGRKDEMKEKHDVVDFKDILKKVIDYEMLGKGLAGTKDNAIVPFDLDLSSSQKGTQSTNENETESQELQYEHLEDFEPLPVSQEPTNITSSNNKRRRINIEDDVTLSQLSWAIAGERRTIETEMVDNIIKLPLISTALAVDATKGLVGDAPDATEGLVGDAPDAKEGLAGDAPDATEVLAGDAPDATEGLAVDAPDATEVLAGDAPVATEGLCVDAPDANQRLHSMKLKLKRNCDGNYAAERVVETDVVKKATVTVINAFPVSFVAPDVVEKNVDVRKESADHVIDATPVRSVAPTNYIRSKKNQTAARVVETKKAARVVETKKEVVKEKKATTKKAETKTVQENAPKAKRGQKRGATAMQENKEDDTVNEKRTVKPSNAMKSPFYDRKVHIYQKWAERDMKVVEYMWSKETPEGEIVFNIKGLGIEGVFFLSLYPEVDVAAPILDIWSIILNNEEKFRDDLSGKRNLYCSTIMLPHRMADFVDGMDLAKKRSTFAENFESVLRALGLKDLTNVGLVFFPCIKITESGSNHYYVICFNLKNGDIDILDNIDNGIEDITVRYGKYAQALIDTFIMYLEKKQHPKIAEIWLANAKMVPMKWKTKYNSVDCGIFAMRHMETYDGEGVFSMDLQTEGADLKRQLKMLRAKYLVRILLKDINRNKKEVLKQAEKFAKKQDKKSKILTHIDIKVDGNLMKKFNETLVKTLE